LLLLRAAFLMWRTMAKNVKDLLAEANSVVPKLSPDQAAEKMQSGDVLIVDVRDPNEVQQTGRIKGAVNVSRGMLEFRADPDSQYHNVR
jgi:predicted sulfurtransferase